MRALVPMVLAGTVSGCLPGMVPDMTMGNDVKTATTNEAPDTQKDVDNKAPIFHINVYANPTVDAVGGNQTISGPVSQAPTVETPPTMLRLEEEEDEEVPEGPRSKGDEPVLIGPAWGGATVNDFNQMICDSVPKEQRVPPVDPVFEGCEAYWK